MCKKDVSIRDTHTLTVSMKLNKTWELLRFEGNKIHCSPRDHSLNYLLYCKTKLKQKSALRFQRQLHALITCNSGQHFAGNSELLPFDVIVFAMLAARGIWG